jgi:hypothetical protein
MIVHLATTCSLDSHPEFELPAHDIILFLQALGAMARSLRLFRTPEASKQRPPDAGRHGLQQQHSEEFDGQTEPERRHNALATHRGELCDENKG